MSGAQWVEVAIVVVNFGGLGLLIWRDPAGHRAAAQAELNAGGGHR